MQSYDYEIFISESMPIEEGDTLRKGDYRLTMLGTKKKWISISCSVYGKKYHRKSQIGEIIEIRGKVTNSMRFILEDY